MLSITRATIDDIEDVVKHYKTVINQIQDYECNPGWKYGIHPTKRHIEKSIRQGELYVGKLNSTIVATLILDKNPLEANDRIQWTRDSDDGVNYIHLVAVNQDYKHHGLARQMLNHAFEIAKKDLIHSIRLSLNVANSAVEKLYLNTGFKYMGTEEVFIENRGNITFNLYEKII